MIEVTGAAWPWSESRAMDEEDRTIVFLHAIPAKAGMASSVSFGIPYGDRDVRASAPASSCIQPTVASSTLATRTSRAAKISASEW